MYYERLVTQKFRLLHAFLLETQASLLTYVAKPTITLSGTPSHAKTLQTVVTCQTAQATRRATNIPSFACLLYNFTTSPRSTDSYFNFHIAFHIHHTTPSRHTATHPT